MVEQKCTYLLRGNIKAYQIVQRGDRGMKTAQNAYVLCERALTINVLQMFDFFPNKVLLSAPTLTKTDDINS